MKNSLDSLVKDAKVIAIVCNQWGDTGKGKFSEYFANNWADVVVSGTGGNNAGHTVKIEDQEFIFHLIPCGALNEKTANIIGNGTAVDPIVLMKEMDDLKKQGYSLNNIFISGDAHFITPLEIFFDIMEDKFSGIGTTCRGIGPSYAMKISRIGVRINDLFNEELFAEKLEKNLEKYLCIARNVYKLSDEQIADIFRHKNIGGDYLNGNKVDIKKIISVYQEAALKFKEKVTNTVYLINKMIYSGKNVLLEGAQGTLLSIEFGTYPYVTSSDCSITGLLQGCGINPSKLDLTFGIVKWPYMTRVGGGPFPTEISNESLDKGENKETEKRFKLDELLKAGDPVSLRRYLRIKGNESGATTGRPRRPGWIDLVALKWSLMQNGKDIIITKPDVCSELDEINMCFSYTYCGQDTYYDGQTFEKGKMVHQFPTSANILSHCRPNYITLKGWKQAISKIETYEDLPKEMRIALEKTELETVASIRMISVGPERRQTIVK